LFVSALYLQAAGEGRRFCITKNEIQRKALALLARREHSRFELRRKLLAKTDQDDANVIDEVLQSLSDQGLQSDTRFAEAYVRMRSERGYGPLRIALELSERGLNEAVFDQFLTPEDDFWFALITRVRQKRFGKSLPSDFAERARQMRFLQYRGFTHEQIQATVKI
jgi:regulatory protein